MLRLQRDSLDDQVQRIEWVLREEAAQGDSGAAGTAQQWEVVTRLNQERSAVSPVALRVPVRGPQVSGRSGYVGTAQQRGQSHVSVRPASKWAQQPCAGRLEGPAVCG